MTKQEYTKVLAKIENKNRQRVIEFFQSIPYFSKWSKSQVSKIMVSFSLSKVSKG